MSEFFQNMRNYGKFNFIGRRKISKDYRFITTNCLYSYFVDDMLIKKFGFNGSLWIWCDDLPGGYRYNYLISEEKNRLKRVINQLDYIEAKPANRKEKSNQLYYLYLRGFLKYFRPNSEVFLTNISQFCWKMSGMWRIGW